MHHFVAHAFPPDFLFRDWREAQFLWAGLLALGPPRALVIMPDHVHLISRHLSHDAWLGFIRGYACWRNHHRSEPGRCVWLPVEPAEPVVDSKHLRRTVRYVALNPCRDRLVADPLAWPFSGHRDAVGLAVPCVLPLERDPFRHHAYVSSDPSVMVEGTDLPGGMRGMRDATPAQVTAAVSALTRTTLDQLQRRGPARALLIQSLVACTPLSKRAIARELGMSASAVCDSTPISEGDLRCVERVLCDKRFDALHDHDLRRSWAWRQYQEGRIRRGAYDALLAHAEHRLRRRSVARRRT